MTRRTLLVLTALSLLVACLVWTLPSSARPGAQSALRREALGAAQKAYALHQAGLAAGTVKAQDVYFWSTRWLQMGGANAKQLQAHVARMKALLARVERGFKTGTVGAADAAAARFYLAEAHLWRARGATP